MLAIFSVTLNGRKIYLYRWKHQNNTCALSTLTLLVERSQYYFISLVADGQDKNELQI